MAAKDQIICTGCGERKLLSEMSASWPKRCLNCVSRYQRDYYADHPGKRRAYDRRRWSEARDARILELGGKCGCCGENELAFLRTDKKTGVLCFNCHAAVKRLGACPHKVRVKASTAAASAP